MFNRAFTKFLDKKPSKKELYPYLYSIAFKELGNPKKEIKYEPIRCKNCEAVFTDNNLIQEDPQKGSYYVCEFCGTINTIDKTKIEKNLPNDIDFIYISQNFNDFTIFQQIKYIKHILIGSDFDFPIDVIPYSMKEFKRNSRFDFNTYDEVNYPNKLIIVYKNDATR